jgi:hypothetical protein
MVIVDIPGGLPCTQNPAMAVYHKTGLAVVIMIMTSLKHSEKVQPAAASIMIYIMVG